MNMTVIIVSRTFGGEVSTSYKCHKFIDGLAYLKLFDSQDRVVLQMSLNEIISFKVVYDDSTDTEDEEPAPQTECMEKQCCSEPLVQTSCRCYLVY